MRVLVTGADGFVGTAVCAALAERGHHVIAATRNGARVPDADEARLLGDLAQLGDADALVSDAEAIVHLAARVHVMDDMAADPLAEYRRVNVAGTRRLAEAAARRGVGRLVFLSSVKVHGEATPDRAFTEDDAPDPQDAYGRSKWEAEQALAEIAARDGLETVTLRAPLVYGPGVKGNFLSLLTLCDSRRPLPLGGVTKNRRSLIYVDNLADAVCTTLEHANAAGEIFLVSDGLPVSTAVLVRGLRTALGRPDRLLPVPPRLLRLALATIGRGGAADRLTGSLAVDVSCIRTTIGWRAPWALQAGLTATADWYRHERLTGNAADS